MKRVVSVFCALLLIVGLCGCKAQRSSITIYDASNNLIATVKSSNVSDKEVKDKSYKSYVQYVVDEAIQVFANKNNCNLKDAEKILYSNDFSINTTLDSKVHSALCAFYEKSDYDNTPIGCSVTDLSGAVRAIFSSDGECALDKVSPYSAFKPLSVYAQAVEKGIVNWSTMYEDMPYKQIKDDRGEYTDWPKNASGKYSYEKTPIVEAVRHSINTVAVFTLKDVGVKNSINFLTSNFGIDLSNERARLDSADEDEVIGNIAMGYLYSGVTTVNMAGYYQIFGNGGTYEKPHSIEKICDSEGKTVYTYSGTEKRVIKSETAKVMNLMLQEVLQKGGTGAAAYSKKYKIAGKTGTGEDNGNWFVGVTPELSIAVWHGKGLDKNTAPEMFAEISLEIPEPRRTDFPTSAMVRKSLYCVHSGGLYTVKCKNMAIGYYALEDIPSPCKTH